MHPYKDSETIVNDDINAVELAAELTAAWLANPNTRTNAEDVPAFLRSMHAAVAQLSGPATSAALEEAAQAYEPAVTVRRSLASPDHIVSMIDGKAIQDITPPSDEQWPYGRGISCAL